jgi:hypothetical protein
VLREYPQYYEYATGKLTESRTLGVAKSSELAMMESASP